MGRTFRDTEEQERFFRKSQLDKYTHLYAATFLVPYAEDADTPTLRSAILQVEEDSDFHITHILGSVLDPVTGTAPPITRAAPLEPTFQMAGTDTGRADRGLDFRIKDPGSGRMLTNVVNSRNITLEGDYIPFAAAFAPGYAFRFCEPVPFEYYIEKKRRLLLEVRNRATANEEEPSDFSARVTFAFLGHRMNP